MQKIRIRRVTYSREKWIIGAINEIDWRSIKFEIR